jgi:hypothetical protein
MALARQRDGSQTIRLKSHVRSATSRSFMLFNVSPGMIDYRSLIASGHLPFVVTGFPQINDHVIAGAILRRPELPSNVAHRIECHSR